MQRIDPIYCIAQSDPGASKALCAKYNVPCTDDVNSIYAALKVIANKPGGLDDIFGIDALDARNLVNKTGNAVSSNFSTEELAVMKTDACKLSLEELKNRKENLVNTASYARFNSTGKQDLDQQIAILDECIKTKEGTTPAPAAGTTGSTTMPAVTTQAKIETGLKIAMVCIVVALVIKGLAA